jgi:hypothetical protein
MVPQDGLGTYIHIALSTYQTGKNVRIRSVAMTHLAVLDGFHTSLLVLQAIYRVSNKHGWGREIKPIILIPALQLSFSKMWLPKLKLKVETFPKNP